MGGNCLATATAAAAAAAAAAADNPDSAAGWDFGGIVTCVYAYSPGTISNSRKLIAIIQVAAPRMSGSSLAQLVSEKESRPAAWGHRY